MGGRTTFTQKTRTTAASLLGDKFDLAQCGSVINEATLKGRRPFPKKVLRGFLKSHLYTLSHRTERLTPDANSLMNLS